MTPQKKNLQKIIVDYLLSDDGFTDLNDRNIANIYSSIDENQKFTLDEIFMNLCGYSLGTILISHNRIK